MSQVESGKIVCFRINNLHNSPPGIDVTENNWLELKFGDCETGGCGVGPMEVGL